MNLIAGVGLEAVITGLDDLPKSKVVKLAVELFTAQLRGVYDALKDMRASSVGVYH